MIALPVVSAALVFQFTHPGGVRPLASCFQRSPLLFQFTHPGGVRRDSLARRVGRARVSIHAPGRGATCVEVDLPALDEVSIHAPGRGATGYGALIERRIRVSIHAPGRGATLRATEFSADRDVSIHAPGRGATSNGIITSN